MYKQSLFLQLCMSFKENMIQHILCREFVLIKGPKQCQTSYLSHANILFSRKLTILAQKKKKKVDIILNIVVKFIEHKPLDL